MVLVEQGTEVHAPVAKVCRFEMVPLDLFTHTDHCDKQCCQHGIQRAFTAFSEATFSFAEAKILAAPVSCA